LASVESGVKIQISQIADTIERLMLQFLFRSDMKIKHGPYELNERGGWGRSWYLNQDDALGLAEVGPVPVDYLLEYWNDKQP
jgi:hypothetical protein